MNSSIVSTRKVRLSKHMSCSQTCIVSARNAFQFFNVLCRNWVQDHSMCSRTTAGIARCHKGYRVMCLRMSASDITWDFSSGSCLNPQLYLWRAILLFGMYSKKKPWILDIVFCLLMRGSFPCRDLRAVKWRNVLEGGNENKNFSHCRVMERLGFSH